MFENILRNLLIEHDITQAELSKMAGIPKTTINGWFTAGRKPDYLAIKKLSQFFNVSADFLLGLEDNGYFTTNAINQIKPEYQTLYESLNSFQQAEVRGYMKRILAENKEKKVK